MKAKCWTQIGAAAAIFALAEVAFAVPIALTLTPVDEKTVGPQSESNPCIIAATNCAQPAGMGFNNFTANGNVSSYNMFSTTPTGTVADGVEGTPYTVQQLKDNVALSFLVAIDVNTTNEAGETLQLFEVIDKTTNTVLYNYVGPHLIGNISNNGNGYADWTLGVVNLGIAGVALTDQILFHANWTGASDGGESFFLVAGTSLPPTRIPEPTTLALLAIAMLGIGAIRRRRTV